MKKTVNRRAFLKLGAVTGAVTGLSGGFSIARADTSTDTESGVKEYVRLGRTNLMLSDISFGSSQLNSGDEYLVDYAIDHGINFIDTAESYTRSNSETVIGNALKGKRDKVHLATKTFAGSDTRKETIMRSLEESLARLQTDHVEIFFNHAVNNTSRMKNDEWYEFAELAKKQGKIQFTGISGHAGNLIECADYALDNNLVDVLLLGHNFGQDPAFYEKFIRSFDLVANQPDLPRVMAKAKKQDVGVVAMKVLRGARLNDMRPFESDGHTYSQAAFKWALSSPNVDISIVSMTSKANIAEYLGASGVKQVTEVDFKLLEQYARLTNMTYCNHACDDCSGACPYDVQISDVLRTRMYATDYGNVPFAKAEYAMLDVSANECLTCDGKPCQDACSQGINIAQLCGPTHLMLS